MADTTYTEDLTEVKRVADTLENNKVAKFAYTEEAYAQDKADGVVDYNFNRANNIPVGTPEILNVNETILTKGYRARSSSITRMLMNHFFGRISYNLNKISDTVRNLINTLKNNLGAPNGYASLDENGRIPFSQLPESAIEYQGNWNAETNEPPLSDEMEGATSGDFYIVSVAGTHDFGSGEITFLVNDRVIYNKENKWEKLAGGNVHSVNEKEPDNETGNITLYGTDIPTSETEGMNIIEKIKQYVGSTLLGRHWEYTNIKDVYFKEEPVFADGLWVASSNDNKGVWYSVNGRHWEQSNLTEKSFSAVVHANGVWVVSDLANSGSSGIWYSLDGKLWTQTNIDAGLYTNIHYFNGFWFAVGGMSNGYCKSSDGITWVKEETSGVFSFHYEGGMWFRQCNNIPPTKLEYSTDGETWYPTNITTANMKILFGIVRGDNPNVWIAQGGSTVWHSYNGIDWENDLTDVFVSWVAYGNYLFLINYGDTIKYSTDGVNWNDTNLSIGAIYKPLYANGIWITYKSYQSNNGMYFSYDGINWEFTDFTNGGLRFAFINGTWFTFGSSRFYYSLDGIIWNRVNLARLTTSNWSTVNYIAYANGVCIADIPADEKHALIYSDVQTLIDNGWLK